MWLLPVCASAQRIEGRVTTAEGTALSFVNIGVLSNTRGTVSDEEGYFQLQLDDMAGGDTLRFSLIGYESYDIGVAAARRQSAPLAIPLKATAYDLAEVVVAEEHATDASVS
ncbi:MAG: carboxypeptidase-like regulatory domain-containing protein [Bacteroidota bacterium]